MFVYVLNKNGEPLMPTKRFGKVRRILKNKQAKVIKRSPFTVQLLYQIDNPIVQDISLGVDAGSKHIGLSATTEKYELYAEDVELRNDIVKNISTKREHRRARRHRKTRHRKPRFNNRKRDEKWLAPSVRQKIETHLTVIERVHKILPIKAIIVETAAFDIQKLKADIEDLARPKGKEYQQGEKMGFSNSREYVLFRDNYTCQCCKGKSKDKILNVHHIESRMTGGDAPNNLITLCETCHTSYHQGKIKLPSNIKRKASFRDAAFMGIMRWALYDKLKETYDNVKMTFGYITKMVRIENNLEKTHVVDARCISGNIFAKPLGMYYYTKKVRCHNRSLHKATIQKGGTRKANQAPKYVFGFQLFDKVLYNNQECFIFGRRTSGSFDVRKLDGTKLSAGVSYKKLKLIEKRKSYLTEVRKENALLPNL